MLENIEAAYLGPFHLLTPSITTSLSRTIAVDESATHLIPPSSLPPSSAGAAAATAGNAAVLLNEEECCDVEKMDVSDDEGLDPQLISTTQPRVPGSARLTEFITCPNSVRVVQQHENFLRQTLHPIAALPSRQSLCI